MSLRSPTANLESPPADSQYFLSRWIYLRVFAITFLFAFLGLADQVLALIGAEGIDPAAANLGRIRACYGDWAWLRVPSVFWLSTADPVLLGAAWIGVVASALAVLNIVPRAALTTCWLLFLSICGLQAPEVRGIFFGYPPDEVLLEGGLFAVFLAPRGRRPGLGFSTPVSSWGRWLTYFLVFKLMVGSGLAKLANGDEAWWDLTALFYDFESRPAATPLAVYGHELPMALIKAGTLFTLIAEVLIPWLYFWPRKPRVWAGIITLALMAAIMATGNYRWFPLTTFAFAVLLLDDGCWRRLLRRTRWGDQNPPTTPARKTPSRPRRLLTGALGTFILLIGGSQTLDFARPHDDPLRLGGAVRDWVRPYHLSHGYNLFGVVERRLLVLVFEGSDDGETWREFRGYVNPSELSRRPVVIAPYHYYLDFVCWASAIVTWNSNPLWVQKLLHGLLRGHPSFFALFREVPWTPSEPPRFVRISTFHYEFATPAERAQGQWWTRQRIGPWSPTVTLADGELRVVAVPAATVR